ncbi:hypothetical protein GCM10010174_19890 [Kutzneria viridogrisea]|uniref:Uncharacterized protein n=2 Tax=Kutzneria TaxID=43356 RepID=W5WF10_9PSEU|nr:hypothetical protein [Kutzneria albida]AHH99350.1 hypothetical protein KALB_5990 [Kutzneria albida DSM 43870]MBA8923095.1 hypothetical protein [Kutzneria viridogrisea]
MSIVRTSPATALGAAYLGQGLGPLVACAFALFVLLLTARVLLLRTTTGGRHR